MQKTEKQQKQAPAAPAVPSSPLDALRARLAAAPEADYEVGTRGQTGLAILETLAKEPGQPFTEPMLAEAIGAMRPDGKPRQQAVNGPLRRIWEQVQEGQVPAVLADKGLSLEVQGRRIGGRVIKVWVAVPAPAKKA